MARTRKAKASTRGKTARRKKASGKRKAVRRAKTGRKPAARAKRPGRKTRRPRSLRPAGDLEFHSALRGLGAEAAGQSGDTEGLSRGAVADSESVEELVEEGQAFEAGIVDAVENAPDADEGEIRTREVPEDDVPEEYRDRD
jgi:hypothetical protein